MVNCLLCVFFKTFKVFKVSSFKSTSADSGWIYAVHEVNASYSCKPWCLNYCKDIISGFLSVNEEEKVPPQKRILSN